MVGDGWRVSRAWRAGTGAVFGGYEESGGVSVVALGPCVERNALQRRHQFFVWRSRGERALWHEHESLNCDTGTFVRAHQPAEHHFDLIEFPDGGDWRDAKGQDLAGR